MDRTEHDVVIAGGGPTGMMLAAELALAGVDALVVERRAGPELTGSRAGGLHSRTIEVLDQRGIAERFLRAGRPMQVQSFAMIPLDISDFPTRHNYGLALWQHDVERLLAEWIDELGVTVARGSCVTGVTQDGAGVDVALADGTALRARFLVGCDGGRSVVRKAVGIDFPGWDATRSTLVAEAELTETPPEGVHRDGAGVHGFHVMEGGRTIRIVTTEPELAAGRSPGLADLRAALVAAFGTDFGAHHVTSVSRFTDAARQASSYRNGHVLLAGDAAHVHYPVGGQGLNIGLQDAVNLGWKLARVARGMSPERLLDTYEEERHPIAARVLENTMAQTALTRADARTEALRATMSDVLRMDEPRRHVGAMISGLDVCYGTAEHPLVGRRMPDLDLRTEDHATRVYSLLHDARPLLLSLAAPGDVRDAARRRGVRVVEARSDGPWELPVIGAVLAPGAVLIRPDGHVAWAGDDRTGCAAALDTWFGES